MTTESAALVVQTRTLRRAAWKRVLRNPAALCGLTVLLLFALAAVFAPLLAPFHYDAQNLRMRLTPPAWMDGGVAEHLLGTDALGRDLFSRILYGARISLTVAVTGVLAGGAIGIVLGLLCGFIGGRFDNFVMRLAEVQLAFPYLLLAIAVIAALGTSLLNLILVLGLRTWVVYARTVRASVLAEKELEYVQAGMALGVSGARVLFKHILPNIASPAIVLVTVELSQLILMETTLSFLGLGVQPPFPSWGSMLSAGRDYLASAWWLATFPGLTIMVAVMAANLLGDGLRDALDSKTEGQRPRE